MIQAQVLDDRGRLGVVIPPVADALDATLRWYMIRRETMDLLVRWDSLSPAAASLLVACMRTPAGVLLTGPPGSGKTSLGNAMLRAAPAGMRVVCCEDTPELQTDHLNASRWRTRPTGPDGSGGVTLRDLVRMALGMRPDLIVVGEVKGAEAYELTRAGNSGCGLLTTLHANSARQGLQALVSTAIMAGQNVPADQVRSVFASVIDLVVHTAREPVELKRAGGGPIRRQVMEIVALPPLAGSNVQFDVEPIFVREEFGAPLRWTGTQLPDDLWVRLDRALRPLGVTMQGIFEGRETLL
jgi:Flp pilus assembly CpaF family ATPase